MFQVVSRLLAKKYLNNLTRKKVHCHSANSYKTVKIDILYRYQFVLTDGRVSPIDNSPLGKIPVPVLFMYGLLYKFSTRLGWRYKTFQESKCSCCKFQKAIIAGFNSYYCF